MSLKMDGQLATSLELVEGSARALLEAQHKLLDAARRWGVQPPCQICHEPILRADREPATAVILAHKRCVRRHGS